MSEGFESDERHQLDDDELVARVRGGDNAAFDELYRRHHLSARRTARWMTRSDHAADDIVADVFASMLSALRNGRGPDGNFTAYLRTAVRNRCSAHRKAAARATPTDDEEFEGRAANGSTSDASATSQLVATAFAALNPRWQRTLWMSAVEGRSAKDIADELNLPVAAVPALAYRARRAFAEAYLRQHAEQTSDATCKALADKLPRYVRGSASRRDTRKIDLHLEHCSHCQRTVSEMSDLNLSLRSLPAPPVAAFAAGAGGVAAWLTTAAAIGAVVVVPVIALRGDNAPSTAGTAEDVTVPAPAAVGPAAAAAVPITVALDTARATTGPSDTTATEATVPADVPDPAPADEPTVTVPPGQVPEPTVTHATAPPDTLDEPDADEPVETAPPVSPTTVPPTPSTDPLVPPTTVPVTATVPPAPIDAGAGVSDDGVAVDVDVGGLDADVSAGGGGVQATVVLPTVPLVGTLPPIVVDVPLPPPVGQIVDDLLSLLFGQP